MQRTAIVGQDTNNTSRILSKDMFTADPFRGMEVTIQGQGMLKGHKAMVVGSVLQSDEKNKTSTNKGKMPANKKKKPINEENTTVTLRTMTQAINTTVSMPIDRLVDNWYNKMISPTIPF